jgi:hypothetical protein
MFRFVFLGGILLLFSQKTVAFSSAICDTIPLYIPNAYVVSEEEENAEWWLMKAKGQNRKAIQAMFFTVPTVGIFYPIALFWSISALYNSRKAYVFFTKQSLNEYKRTDANKTYWKAISIFLIHLAFWVALLLRRFTELLNTGTLAASARIVFLASLGIVFFIVLDYYVFKTFFS